MCFIVIYCFFKFKYLIYIKVYLKLQFFFNLLGFMLINNLKSALKRIKIYFYSFY